MVLHQPQMGGSPYESERVALENSQGWTSDENTWSFVEGFSPSFVVSVSADATATLSPGMRWRGYQGDVLRQAIITAVGTYSGGVTQVTLYVGTDYTITDADIEDVSFSFAKAPFGFPLNPDKWSVEVAVTNEVLVTSPVALTWYNVTSIVIPIGIWNVHYDSYQFVSISGTGTGDIYATLSTSPSSDSSNGSYVHFFWSQGNGGAGTTAQKTFGLNLSSKTTYYFNIMNDLSNPYIQVDGVFFPTIIRAVSAYL